MEEMQFEGWSGRVSNFCCCCCLFWVFCFLFFFWFVCFLFCCFFVCLICVFLSKVLYRFFYRYTHLIQMSSGTLSLKSLSQSKHDIAGRLKDMEGKPIKDSTDTRHMHLVGNQSHQVKDYRVTVHLRVSMILLVHGEYRCT